MAAMIMGLPIWRPPSIFRDVLSTVRFLDVAKFTTQTPLPLLILCKHSFPSVGLKMSSLSTFALKSPNRMFMWYLGKLSNTG
jgi:hypothetical protein